MKLKTIVYLSMYVIALSVGAYTGYLVGNSKPKIVYKEKIIENVVLQDNMDKIAEAELKVDKMINFIDNSEKKEFAKIALHKFNLNIDVSDLDTAFQNAKALSVIMYNECNVCSKTERIFVGMSAYYNAVNFYNGSLVTTKNSREAQRRTCNYTYSFMCSYAKREYIPSNNLNEYLADSINIIYNANDDFAELRNYYVSKNGKNKVHFCNTGVAGDCSWHESALRKAGGKPYKLILNEQTDSNSVDLDNLSKHTFYPIIKAQKGKKI